MFSSAVPSVLCISCGPLTPIAARPQPLPLSATSGRRAVCTGPCRQDGFLSTSVLLHLQNHNSPPLPPGPAAATGSPQGKSGSQKPTGPFSDTWSPGRNRARSSRDGSNQVGFICSDEYCTESRRASLTCRAPSLGRATPEATVGPSAPSAGRSVGVVAPAAPVP